MGAGDPLTIDGVEYEQLSPDSMQMLAAVREGKLPDFLLSHPQFVASASRPLQHGVHLGHGPAPPAATARAVG